MLKIYNFTKLRNCQLLNRQVVNVREALDGYQIVLREPSSEIVIDLYKDKLDSTYFTYKSGKGPNCYPMRIRAFENNNQSAERYFFLPINSMGSVNEFIDLIQIICKTGINELKNYVHPSVYAPTSYATVGNTPPAGMMARYSRRQINPKYYTTVPITGKQKC